MNIKAIFAAAVIAVTPVVASAATLLNIGDTIIESNTLNSGDSVSYEYEAATDIRILDFVSVSSVGFSEDDLLEITFGYTSPDIADVIKTYDAGDINPNGATFEGDSTITGFNLTAGQKFTVFFDYSLAGVEQVSNQFNFKVAAVPLPAGGLLLLTALGGLGIARRRKAAA